MQIRLLAGNARSTAAAGRVEDTRAALLPSEAFALSDLSRVLLDEERPVEAEDAARTALAIAQRIGMRGLSERIQSRLRRLDN